ncbi:restriction endonuclease subunit S [Pseudomonas sp. zfem003]|uniref:restriction endonuclease subunit S n=1 Tax=Pseudomonas sp. zfem003 TaxID=3078198 RepID=UPI002927FCFC|nr:restriction endonuclease subunit S [Pseudomonas sp. zfem003]MDU9399932.1 restriction endonuclease subunit S [Pseudomonas sp. zfem003]
MNHTEKLTGWASSKLAEIISPQSSICYGVLMPGEFTPNGIPLIRVKDINKNIVNDEQIFLISQELDSEFKRSKVTAGTILISIQGTVGCVAITPEHLENANISRTIAKLELAEPVMSKWIWASLLSPQGQEKMLEETGGSTRASLNISALREIELPIPPLAEQTRIAQKLDELLAQVDTLKARIDGIPALLKRFRQSVLAAAVSGRLTEEWRSANSDSKSQHNSNMPVGWSQIPLGRYAINFDGARRPISAKERESLKGDYPYFGATGQIDSIDGYTHEGEFVLVGEDGANLLTRAKPIAFIAQGKIWVNNHAHVIASPTGHSNSYLAFYLNTLDITPWVSGSAQPKLNQKNMNEIPVFVPPPEEQTEIVCHIEQLFAFADQLEAKVASAKSSIDQLTQSILAKAFRGELVPQDPNDEPASVLLERIKAQRAAAPKARRARKAP